MKERIHEQITYELKQAVRMDTITVIIGLTVTLILFAAAAIFAAQTTGSIVGGLTGFKATSVNAANTVIMWVIIVAIVAINWYAVRTLLNNRKQRSQLNEGLMKLYKDEAMDQYYDGSIFKGYETRYNLFAVMLAAVGAVSVITPLVIFIDKMVAL
ncbi:MAG: hypothetical protein JXA17_06455 [Dehalococcoidales bacterium]|nr:hypothetical protein [Dehalococcoidales bacterium]